jgi:hypothetical protein
VCVFVHVYTHVCVYGTQGADVNDLFESMYILRLLKVCVCVCVCFWECDTHMYVCIGHEELM